MTPLRAFFCSFAAGLLALTGGHSLISSLTATPVDAPPKGPLTIPDA
ncbi:MAG: hypothetical protein KF780_11985 [Sphingomonas sp.]|nr:hypothetical protein [Sphingomonas sp.]